ncbi:uncharacterized protein DUF4102 [Paraburkholderia sp. BL27I4N3]|uniref:integrase family protein n=1 Tax=Paraburkholderia sp. BL27I4N3 TaxID=1938805 RepID=UPI000E366881|nr:integrase family protein [Paraburkholderia sp. BL27I4N3]REE17959.1 uncharacterized protein DUF4102 [Paraburkholderia sp. BL27I4N3]
MFLEVMPNGSKYWRLKYRIDGKERRAVLGVYPAVSLLAARKVREEIKDALRPGLDPSAEKKRAVERRQRAAIKDRTVADAFEEYGRKVSATKEGSKWERNRLKMFVRDVPEFSGRRLADADAPMWADWREIRLKGFIRPEGTIARPVKASTVQREMNLYRNVFTIARREWKRIDENTFTDVASPPNGPPRERRPDPWKEIRPIVRWLGYRTGQEPVTKSQEVALAYLVAPRSGMRAKELLGLGKGTLNMRTGVAEVRHKMQYLTKRPR